MIAEATIREALTEPLRTEGEMLTIIKAAKFKGSEPPPAGSLFEACCAAVRSTDIGDKSGWVTVLTNGADESVTRAVIQTLIDRTESPTTCAELTRILAGAV